MCGGKSTGAPKGNRNSGKHGFYSAELIAERKHFAELVREAEELQEVLARRAAVE